jgi:hypothetical protein
MKTKAFALAPALGAPAILPAKAFDPNVRLASTYEFLTQHRTHRFAREHFDLSIA